MLVERLDHNLGKIHDVPVARFRLTRFEIDGKTPLGDARDPGNSGFRVSASAGSART